MVALVVRGDILFCGGTVISDIYVLTAAHCLQPVAPTNIEIVLSEGNKVNMKADMAERRKVLYAVIHENYHQSRDFSNDIALLRLDRPLRIDYDRTPICLPMPGRSYAGEMAKVLGWGLTSEKGNRSSELREAIVPVLSQNTCKSLSGYMRITDGMMCAAPLSGGVDSCQGDSGGPLLIKTPDGRLVIIDHIYWLLDVIGFKRIVSGDPSMDGEFPWMAAIFIYGRYSCSGGLITQRHVLTAGHCFQSLDYFIAASEVKIAVGLILLSDIANPGVLKPINKLFIYPKLRYEEVNEVITPLNDLAIVQLKNKLTFSPNAMPLKLPSKGKLYFFIIF
ncbi:hypothetical protein O3M35_009194 [Rhynocoris fuscipes]|uniref:Peptidase S1 domain-containing protein n=1 Tax=Rhynocoris fuscipes TaxID=488301 RepID=A0AAW1D8Z1_9HEMI